MLAYWQLLEMDRLEDAKALDARYHAAKLAAAANSDRPGIIWEEHEAVRAELLSTQADAEPRQAGALSTEDHLALALSIHERLVAAGVLPPESGVH